MKQIHPFALGGAALLALAGCMDGERPSLLAPEAASFAQVSTRPGGQQPR